MACEFETCQHSSFPDQVVIEMAPGMRGYGELVRLKERGMPYWWLWAGRCCVCGEPWLVGQEERQNDLMIMRRLTEPELDRILETDDWPDDFDRYETLLRIGAAQAKRFRYMNPDEQLPQMIDLARERPGISVDDLSWLLNMEPAIAVELARRAVVEGGVDISFS